MSIESAISKNKNRIKYLYSKSKMLELKLKGLKTIDSRAEYLECLDLLEDELSNYYSNSLMRLKELKSDLFETYLSLPKEKVKKNLFAELLKEFKVQKEIEPKESELKFNRILELKK